jgi:DNA-binding MarR family transcriptional regulator
MAASRLQRELKKKRPFESLEQEANLNVLRTTDLLQNRFGRFFREYGLTASQYNVLRILRGEESPMRSLEIGERMIQVVPAITGLIDRLEKQNLVSRRRCEKDRRVVYVQITSTALKLLKQIDQPLLDLHKQLSGPLTRSEVRELTRLMEKLRSGLEDERQ